MKLTAPFDARRWWTSMDADTRLTGEAGRGALRPGAVGQGRGRRHADAANGVKPIEEVDA